LPRKSAARGDDISLLFGLQRIDRTGHLYLVRSITGFSGSFNNLGEKMRISFGSTYLSIKSFPDIDVPDFCLLTGLNGAGKSHFLQALQAGNLRADCAPNQSPQNPTEVRFFDWKSLVPQDTGIFMSENLRNERVEAFNQYTGIRNQPHIIENIRHVVRQLQLPEKYILDPVSVGLLSTTDLAPLCGQQDPQQVYNQLQQVAVQSQNQLLNQTNEPVRSRIRTVAVTSGKPLLSLTQRDFFQSNVSSWGEVQHLSAIFCSALCRLP
jgi:hypothetical protein